MYSRKKHQLKFSQIFLVDFIYHFIYIIMVGLNLSTFFYSMTCRCLGPTLMHIFQKCLLPCDVFYVFVYIRQMWMCRRIHTIWYICICFVYLLLLFQIIHILCITQGAIKNIIVCIIRHWKFLFFKTLLSCAVIFFPHPMAIASLFTMFMII